jgi:hypothetical protein
MSHEKLPCIIFLKGVNKSDYKEVEDQFDQILLESTLQTETLPIEPAFDVLPTVFTSLDNWPDHTNLHCWTCECTFTNKPIFIPLHIKGSSNGMWDMNTHGVFCSFSCAARHIKDFMDNTLFTNLFHLYFIFYKKEVKCIYASPRRYCTKKYGGHMIEEEYIEEIRRLENEIDNNLDDKVVISRNTDYRSDEEHEMSVWNITEKMGEEEELFLQET